jgi:hypothetical protein
VKEILHQLNDLNDVVPFFSPDSFLVFINDDAFNHFRIAEVEAAVNSGDGRRANELLRQHITSLSPQAESSLLRAFTATFHEFKHYWDHIGTTYGLARLGLALNRQISTHSLLDLVREGEPLGLPLLANRAQRFSDEAKAEKLLADISETLFHEKILDDVGIRAFVVDIPPEKCPPEAHIVVTGSQQMHWVPAYAIRGADAEGRTWVIAIPFGGRSICEGAAMTLELDILNGVFGTWAAEERKRDFMGFDRTDPDRSYYGACDLFLSRHIDPFPFDLLLAMCDLALMGDAKGKERESFHPGWRFRKLVDLVSEKGWPKDKYEWKSGSHAWEEWYRDLFVALNKRSLDEFLVETRSWLAEQIALTSTMDDSLSLAINAIYTAADRVFELRQRVPLILASGNYLYRAMSNTYWDGPAPHLDDNLSSIKLPMPTVVKATDGDILCGEGEPGVLLNLAVQGKVLTDILINTKIVCTLVASSFNCPLKMQGCGQIPGSLSQSDHPSCSFHTTIKGLGILDRRIEVLKR